MTLMPHVLPARPFGIRLRALAAAACLLLAAAHVDAAPTLPAGFSQAQVSGLENPTAMAIAPDGRIFVTEQGGALRVIENGVLLPTPFVQLAVDDDGERGLLGVAFDPQFASNHYVYLYYTTTEGGAHNRVGRFVANGNVAAGPSLTILDLDPLSAATNHNGGAIHFGPDGKLYIAVGENANRDNAQTLTNRLGKMLRINPDGSIPPDNPFYTQATGVNRAIWAYGLRNPYTFAFDPATGLMAINDVGDRTWEEINLGQAGANYGWAIGNPGDGPHGLPQYQDPIYAYQHGSENVCAISGGAFYSPTVGQFPADYAGDYFFADYCGGWIKRLDRANPAAAQLFGSGFSGLVDLHVAADGSLYYLARGGGDGGTGVVGRITYAGQTPVEPPAAPALTAYTNGRTLSLSWTASAGAASYRLEGGSAPGAVNLANMDLGLATSIEGVVPAGTYFTRIRAVGPTGLSAVSNEEQVTLAGGVCATPPPAPAAFVGQGVGLHATLQWAAAPSANYYVVEAGTGPSLANLLQVSVGGATQVATSAPPGTYYTRVRAANACGYSEPSSEAIVTLRCAAGAPANLTVSRTGSVLAFQWTAAPGATSYRAQVGTASGAANLLDLNVGAGTAIAVDTAGVPPGTYYVRILGVTPCGPTAASNEVTVTLP